MPRLTKGSTATGIAAKSESKVLSVKRRFDKFSEVFSLNKPPLEIVKYFSTAGLLAQWSDTDLGIDPVSVKTLRKHIVLFHAEGLADICAKARILLLANQAKENKPSMGRVKQQAEQAIDSALEMTARYLDLIERLKKISRTHEATVLELDKHFKKFGRNPHIKEAK